MGRTNNEAVDWTKKKSIQKLGLVVNANLKSDFPNYRNFKNFPKIFMLPEATGQRVPTNRA